MRLFLKTIEVICEVIATAVLAYGLWAVLPLLPTFD